MRAALLVLPLLLAGCLDAGAGEGRGAGDDAALVVGEAFDSAGTAWVAQVAGGCGFCSGERSFRLSGEHHSLFVFEDGRVLLAEWNGWHQPPGDLHLHENVTYDRMELRRLLFDSPRGRDGELWVVRVLTARLANASHVQDLREAWATGSEDTQCTDAGVSYLFRHPDGAVEEEAFTCGPGEGEPLERFSRRMDALVEATRAEGVAQGEVRLR